MKSVILVDGSNNHAATKALGFAMDYKKLLMLPEFEGAMPFYFTALPDKSVESGLRKLIDYLEYNGWTVIQKPTKEYDNGGVLKQKGNMDIEMALTAVDLCLYGGVEHIHLFAGDGDYRALVEWTQKRGAFVTAYSTLLSSPSPMIADELRRQVNKFVDINDLKPALTRVEGAQPVIAGERKFLQRRV